jgi:hypothetical protein
MTSRDAGGSTAGIARRIALPQRRTLVHRRVRPVPVRRNRRHEHTALGDLGEDPGGTVDHRRHAPGHVDDNIPRTLPGQPIKVPGGLPIAHDQPNVNGHRQR